MIPHEFMRRLLRVEEPLRFGEFEARLRAAEERILIVGTSLGGKKVAPPPAPPPMGNTLVTLKGCGGVVRAGVTVTIKRGTTTIGSKATNTDGIADFNLTVGVSYTYSFPAAGGYPAATGSVVGGGSATRTTIGNGTTHACWATCGIVDVAAISVDIWAITDDGVGREWRPMTHEPTNKQWKYSGGVYGGPAVVPYSSGTISSIGIDTPVPTFFAYQSVDCGTTVMDFGFFPTYRYIRYS